MRQKPRVFTFKFLSLYWVLFAVVLGSGCVPPGPVQRVSIQASEVHEIALHYAPRREILRITDPETIRRCVQELNDLSYTPYWPHIGTRASDDFVVRDSGGASIAEYAFGYDFIEVRLPDSEPFYIKYERMPFLGRVYSYADYLAHKERLQVAVAKEQWDEDARRGVQSAVRNINRAHSGAALGVPKAPSDLREALKNLPDVSLDNLEGFTNYFDRCCRVP